jgi:hypothetical protein
VLAGQFAVRAAPAEKRPARTQVKPDTLGGMPTSTNREHRMPCRPVNTCLVFLLLLQACAGPMRVTGRVMPQRSSLPPTGVRIQVGGRTGQLSLDSAGRFVMRLWPWEGCLRLVISLTGHAPYENRLPARRVLTYDLGDIVLPPSDGYTWVRHGSCVAPRPLPPGYAQAVVAGRVRDERGRNAAGVSLWVACDRTEPPTARALGGASSSAPDGRFEVEVLLPTGFQAGANPASVPPCALAWSAADGQHTIPLRELRLDRRRISVGTIGVSVLP